MEGHRIDYICIPNGSLSRIAACRIADEINLTTSLKLDHSVLVADIAFRPADDRSQASSKPKATPHNK
eukprot:11577175-Karenia_brevis.AAC.1